MVLLFEDERDDSAGFGRLVKMACSEAHDGRLYGTPTMESGLYWISPSGPPATTWTSVTVAVAGIAGIATRRPSKVENAKSLENITSVS